VPLALPLSCKRRADPGHLDPLLMVAGGRHWMPVSTVSSTVSARALIFNLGHGITPQADPGTVTR